MSDHHNLAADLALRAQEVPGRPALTTADGRSWSFAELDAAVDDLASSLAASGVGRGARVATYLRNGPELALALFAAWRIGAVPVTISGLYNARELAGSVEKTEPVLVLVDAHDLPALEAIREGPVRLAALGERVEGVDPLPAGDGTVPVADLAEEDESGILFTGGSTGQPKAVSVTYGGVRSALARLARASKGRPGPYEAVPEDVPPNLLALPLFHSGGQHALLFALHVGRSVVLCERFDVATFGELVERHRFDNLFLLPTMLYDVVHAEPAPDLASVRSVLVAGQALSHSLRQQFEERFRIPIVMNYGSTEIGHVAGWTAAQMAAGLWKPGSAGIVYEGVEVEIRDDDGVALPAGEAGEICVRSQMSKGYVDDPSSTGQLVRDGWVHSGDVGTLDEDGVLFVIGRKRDMIKCGGFQLWPDEIEEELRSHPLVRDVRVVGVPDERLGESPKAFVVREPDAATTDDALVASLLAHANERLARFKVPRAVAFVDELPRSVAGKVRREALLEREQEVEA